MRRLPLVIFALVATLLATQGPGAAQASPDQLNKLSLEALTAPPPGGGHSAVRRLSGNPSMVRGHTARRGHVAAHRRTFTNRTHLYDSKLRMKANHAPRGDMRHHVIPRKPPHDYTPRKSGHH